MEVNNRGVYSNLKMRMGEENMDSLYRHDEKEESEIVSELNMYKKKIKETYVRSILNPETHIGKIPSRMPVESAIAPLKWQFNITPNLGGKFALVLDPFAQTGFLYQDSTVNGTGSGVVTNLTFAQDANIIDQWRLVSSSVIAKYYGNFNQLSGYFVAATTSNVTAQTQTTYLTFNNVEDLSNRQVLKAIDGVKLVYSPMDEKATEFHTQTTYSAGTHPCRWQYLFVIIGDAFPNSSCIRVDYFRNIEYTSVPQYKEYIPQTRDIPCEPLTPVIREPVTPAPQDFRGGRSGFRESEKAYGLIDKLSDALISTGQDLFGSYLTNKVNPFSAFGFK